MEVLNTAKLIAFVRHDAGLTQDELAHRAGTSQPAVARYESGKASPSVSTLLRLIRAGGYDLDVQIKKATPSDLSGVRAQKVRKAKVAIRALTQQAGASNVRLFGSVARGQDTELSDVDLLIDFDLSLGLLPIIRLNRQLSDLLKEHVEVSPVGVLKPEVLESALAEAVPL